MYILKCMHTYTLLANKSLPADYKLLEELPPLEYTSTHSSNSTPALFTPDSFLRKSTGMGGDHSPFSPVSLLSPHDISSGTSTFTNITPLQHGNLSSETGNETGSEYGSELASSLPIHPLVGVMGKRRETDRTEAEVKSGSQSASLLQPLPSSSSSSSSLPPDADLLKTLEGQQSVTPDQQTPPQEKDQSSLVTVPLRTHSSSESASENGQDALVLSSVVTSPPAKSFPWEEGTAMFPSALPDAVNEGTSALTGEETETASKTGSHPPGNEPVSGQELDSTNNEWEMHASLAIQKEEEEKEEEEEEKQGALADNNLLKEALVPEDTGVTLEDSYSNTEVSQPLQGEEEKEEEEEEGEQEEEEGISGSAARQLAKEEEATKGTDKIDVLITSIYGPLV